MEEEQLAAKCLAAAFARLSKKDEGALQVLAEKAGVPLLKAQQMPWCRVVAKCLFKGGEPPSCHLLHARCSQLQHWLEIGSPSQGAWQRADSHLGNALLLQEV